MPFLLEYSANPAREAMEVSLCVPYKSFRYTKLKIRKHLFTDLRPYVCTFEECDLKLFADRHVWFEHELEYHRLEWCCRFCSHSPFQSQAGLKGHMLSRHPEFSSPIQLSPLLQASKQVVQSIAASACTFCDWESTLMEVQEEALQTETLVVTLEQFRRHVGSHMEQLALFALPRSFEDRDDNADSNEAAATANSHPASQNLSSHSTETWGTIGDHDTAVDPTIPDLAPGASMIGNIIDPLALSNAHSDHVVHAPSKSCKVLIPSTITLFLGLWPLSVKYIAAMEGCSSIVGGRISRTLIDLSG